MAVIDDLLTKVTDPDLRHRLSEEVRKLNQNKKFGLVFEEHIPEFTALFGVPIKLGHPVSLKQKSEKIYIPLKFEGDKVICVLQGVEGAEQVKFNRDELVSIAEFGQPIYPYLDKIDEIENAPDSDLWHTLIEGDNFHALQLLEYTSAGKVDCIYIDPPYNTRANDWKYNNDYVNPNDSYTHSKWLSFMSKRLKLAKKLLNPNDSVLIVTIDEKEYIHLGALLEELFPEARMEMITIIMNRVGVARTNAFSRANEYAYILKFGSSAPSKWHHDMLDTDRTEKKAGTIWRSLQRAGNNAQRSDSPNMFYPIWVDPKNNTIFSVGESLPIDENRDDVIPPKEGLKPVWPIRRNGTEGNWQLSNKTLRIRLEKGLARIGTYNKKKDTWSINYLRQAELRRIENGELSVVGHDENGALKLEWSELGGSNAFTPVNVWNVDSHDAGKYGSELNAKFLPDRKFPFPKSLYAVQDAIRFFVADKPEALIVDFFAGSGTTLHAVNLLNAEDNGQRRCIMVTNNEVSKSEADKLSKEGHQPGDPEWDALGIARYITWPRTVASITGKDTQGKKIAGKYGVTKDVYKKVDVPLQNSKTLKKHSGTLYEKVKEIDNPRLLDMKISDGFQANANYFKLGFLDKTAVSLGRQFRELLPVLWLKAGAVGKCPELHNNEVPNQLILPENKMAILTEEYQFDSFKKELRNIESIDTIFIVTDSNQGFAKMLQELGSRFNTYQLYRDYLDNFRINVRRI